MLFGIWLILIKSEVLIMTAVADPDLQIRGPGHQDPDIRGGGAGSKKKISRLFWPQFGLKIRGARPPGPSPGSATGLECSDRSAVTNGNHPRTDT